MCVCFVLLLLFFYQSAISGIDQLITRIKRSHVNYRLTNGTIRLMDGCEACINWQNTAINYQINAMGSLIDEATDTIKNTK